MSADNYWLGTEHPTLGVISIMAFASDDRDDLTKLRDAIREGRYRSHPSDDDFEAMSASEWTEYGDGWVDWPGGDE